MARGHGITLEESANRAVLSEPSGLMTATEYAFEAECTRQAYEEAKAEQEAENGWLRYAENRGWEEAWLEDMIAAGLRSAY